MMTDPPLQLHRKTIVHTASETQGGELGFSRVRLCDPVERTVHGIPPGHNTGVGSTYDAPTISRRDAMTFSWSHSIPGKHMYNDLIFTPCRGGAISELKTDHEKKQKQRLKVRVCVICEQM